MPKFISELRAKFKFVFVILTGKNKCNGEL